MIRREQQAEARRKQLLDTALVLFAQRGFDRTTIKDLAESAGVAQGLIYHYFRSKEELLFAVVERHSFLPTLHDLLAVSPARPASDVLREVAVGFSAMLAEREALLRIVAREAQTNLEVAVGLQQVIGEAVQLLGAYLNTRIQTGELRPHDTRVAARTLFFTIVMLHLTRTPVEGFLPGLIEILLHGIVDGSRSDS